MNLEYLPLFYKQKHMLNPGAALDNFRVLNLLSPTEISWYYQRNRFLRIITHSQTDRHTDRDEYSILAVEIIFMYNFKAGLIL